MIAPNLFIKRSRQRTQRRSVSTVKFQRPDTDDAYAAGDVIGTTAGSVLRFRECGSGGTVTSAKVLIEAETTGDLALLLFDACPLPAPEDNAALAFDMDMGSSLVGRIPLPGSAKKEMATDVWLYDAGTLRLPFLSSDGALYGVLLTEGELAPTEAGIVLVRIGIDP